jgi:hypothetical protein
MFWFGLVLALFGGFLGISSIRAILNRWIPKLSVIYLDVFAILLLISGLIISASVQVQSNKATARLERLSNSIATFDGRVTLQLSGNWPQGIPPSGPVRLMFGSGSVGTLNVTTRSGEKRIALIGQGSPFITPTKDSSILFQYQVTAAPEEWIIGSDRRSLLNCGSGSIRASGIYSKFTLDNMIQIDSMSIELLANGVPLLRVVKAVKERLNLGQGSNSITLRWSSEDCKRTADR